VSRCLFSSVPGAARGTWSWVGSSSLRGGSWLPLALDHRRRRRRSRISSRSREVSTGQRHAVTFLSHSAAPLQNSPGQEIEVERVSSIQGGHHSPETGIE
jgi:hypothetical protein